MEGITCPILSTDQNHKKVRVMKSSFKEADRLGEEEVQVGAKNNEVVNIVNEFNPLSPNVDVSPNPNFEDAINISPNQEN